MIGSAGNVKVEKMYIEEGTSQMKIFFECFLCTEIMCTESYVVFYDIVRFDHHIRKRARIELNHCT